MTPASVNVSEADAACAVLGAMMTRAFSNRIVQVVMALGLGTGAVLASATAADANTCNILNFTTSTACISPVPGGGGGNVTAATMNGFNGGAGAFGITGWMQLDKLDRPGTPAPGVGTTQLSDNGFFSIAYEAPLYKQGTWSLGDEWLWGPGQFAFAIKGATDNAVYLMDLAFRNGAWFVNDLNNAGGNPDMSNIRLFGTSDLAPIPLPPVVLMMLGALGALVVATRRRRATA